MLKTKLEKQQKTFNDFISNFTTKGFRELTVDELFTVNGGKKRSSSSSSSSSGNSGTKNTSSLAASTAVTAATSGASAGKNIGSTSNTNKSGSGKPNSSTSSNSSSSSNSNVGPSDKNSSNTQKPYTVQSGDTLSQITANYNKEHGTNYTYQQVAEKNGISNPDVIHPGQQISFGDTSQPESQPAQQHRSSQNNSSGSHGSSNTTTSVGYSYNADSNHENGLLNNYSSSYNTENPRIQNETLNVENEANHHTNSNSVISKFINSVKNIFTKLSNIIPNDNSSMIFTVGGAASVTAGITSESVGTGIYINPKNNKLLLRTAGMMITGGAVNKLVGGIITAANIEDYGLYCESAGFGVWSSASAGGSFGLYKSVEDAKGPYRECGFSYGIKGLSGGIDFTTNFDNKKIGYSISFGIGDPGLEGHIRTGVTGIYSCSKKCGK